MAMQAVAHFLSETKAVGDTKRFSMHGRKEINATPNPSPNEKIFFKEKDNYCKPIILQ